MQGYFAILSSCWYLNLDTFATDWFDYYTCDPHDFPGETRFVGVFLVLLSSG